MRLGAAWGKECYRMCASLQIVCVCVWGGGGCMTEEGESRFPKLGAACGGGGGGGATGREGIHATCL